MYEGNADSGEKCHVCGSTHVRRAGFVDKLFAKFITPKGFVEMNVKLQCLACKVNGKAVAFENYLAVLVYR